MDKVKFGFKNAYYAVITEVDGVVTYGTPKKLNGAVSMTLSPNGDDLEFYADNNLYYGEKVNNGYDGTLELALIPEDFKVDVLGETVNTDNVAIENAIATQHSFALLCEFTTDAGARKFAFYNCNASRPELAASTTSSSKEVQSETLNLTIRPDANGNVKANTTAETSSTIVNNWYNAVYQENASI